MIANLFRMFFVKIPTESSSCAERLTDRSRDTAFVARSRRTSAVLILPMLLGAFRPPKPDNRICCDTHLMVMLHDTEKQVAGNANVKRACMAAEDLDGGAGHGKMLARSW